MSFGKVMADKRKQLLLSQKDLAAKLTKEDGTSISPQYLNDIEHGRRNAPPDYIIDQIADLLHLDRDALYALAGQIPSDINPAQYNTTELNSAFQAFRKNLPKK
jgi:transcriptional regulator with XRE-family HTH domain